MSPFYSTSLLVEEPFRCNSFYAKQNWFTAASSVGFPCANGHTYNTSNAFKINLFAQFGGEILVFLLLGRRTSSLVSCQNIFTAKASLKFFFPVQVHVPSLTCNNSPQEHNYSFSTFATRRKWTIMLQEELWLPLESEKQFLAHG